MTEAAFLLLGIATGGASTAWALSLAALLRHNGRGRS